MKYVLFLCFLSMVISIPKINLSNYDVREKLFDCWNDGYSQIIGVIINYTG
jgi:hypothetical protein